MPSPRTSSVVVFLLGALLVLVSTGASAVEPQYAETHGFGPYDPA